MEEFKNALGQAKLTYETTVKLSEIEANRRTPTAPTATFDKKYNPRLPPYQESDTFPIYLGSFVDMMTAAQIPPVQWIGHLRGLLTSK